MKLLKLEKWGKGKPILIRILALCYATSADICLEILTEIKENRIPKPFNQPIPSQWFHFYLTKKTIQNKYLQLIRKYGETPSYFVQIYQKLESVGKNDALNRETTEQNATSPKDIFENFIKSIKDDIEGVPLPVEQHDYVTRNLITDEILFFIKIVFPCWLFYRCSHIRLYRNARQGHIESLDKLLRLDKMQIQNPRINKWLYLYSTGV